MREVSVFKAVTQELNPGAKYGSAFVWASVGKLYYSIGVWTSATPKLARLGYHPTVFLTEQSARLFVEQAMPVRLRLFRATGRGRIEQLHPRGFVYNEQNPVQPYDGEAASWPYGTAMFKEVRLDSFYGSLSYKPFLKYEWELAQHNRPK